MGDSKHESQKIKTSNFSSSKGTDRQSDRQTDRQNRQNRDRQTNDSTRGWDQGASRVRVASRQSVSQSVSVSVCSREAALCPPHAHVCARSLYLHVLPVLSRQPPCVTLARQPRPRHDAGTVSI